MPNDAARALGRLAAQILGSSSTAPALCCTADLEVFYDLDAWREVAAPAARFGELPSDGAILVLDDVVTSGGHLGVLQRALRFGEYRGIIHYVVGIDRMSSAEKLNGLTIALRHNEFGPSHSFVAVESVRLPDWDDQSCPWCAERKILDDLIRLCKSDTSVSLRERANELRQITEQGAGLDVFMPVDGVPPMSLSINSLFVDAPAPPATVAAAVAAALQEMRAEPSEQKRLDSDGFPVRSILGHAALQRYFSDPILRASILRCALALELRKSDEQYEAERAKWVRDRLVSDEIEDRQLRRELLLAVLTEKLPTETLDSSTLDVLRSTGFAEFCDMVETKRT
jgi:hypothetical protein